MEKNLPVKYKSQWDPDANSTNDDCGPTALATVIAYLSKKDFDTNTVSKLVNSTGLVTIPSLKEAANKLGYNLTIETNSSIVRLKELIDTGVPPIILVHYGGLNSTQDKNYKGGHFMTVVGYRADDSFYVNDPDFQAQERNQGDHHVYTKDEINRAWGDASQDGNTPNTLLVVTPRAETPVVTTTPKASNSYKVYPYVLNLTANDALRVRTTPQVNTANIVKGLKGGEKFTAEGFVVGDDVSGNNLWWKFKGEDLYVWSGGTNAVPTLQDVKEPVPSPSNDIVDRNAKLEYAITQVYAILDPLKKSDEEIANEKAVKSSVLGGVMKSILGR